MYLYAKTRDTFVRSYLVFYTAFSAFVVSETFSAYVRANIPIWDVERLQFFMAPISFFLIFAAAMFVHDLFSVPQARLRNAVICGAMVLL